jgi:hypothetical protein
MAHSSKLFLRANLADLQMKVSLLMSLLSFQFTQKKDQQNPKEEATNMIVVEQPSRGLCH